MRHPWTLARTCRLLCALVALLALAAAGCSGGGDDATTATEPADDAAPADAPADAATDDAAGEGTAGEGTAAEGTAAEEPADPAGEVVVDVADSDLGQILVDAEGRTLYGFTNDTGGTASCTDDCAATWPPLIVEAGFTVGEDLDVASFTTTEREDGSLQLVLGDWPLYLYQADAAAGDVNGQGVGEVWFVVDPSGELIQEDIG